MAAHAQWNRGTEAEEMSGNPETATPDASGSAVADGGSEPSMEPSVECVPPSPLSLHQSHADRDSEPQVQNTLESLPPSPQQSHGSSGLPASNDDGVKMAGASMPGRSLITPLRLQRVPPSSWRAHPSDGFVQAFCWLTL